MQQAEQILATMSLPILVVGEAGRLRYANLAAEEFFGIGRKKLTAKRLDAIVPFGSPILALVEDCLATGKRVNEYALDIMMPVFQPMRRRIIDLQVAPFIGGDAGAEALLIFQPRAMAQQIDRQLTHRGAARSVSAMAALLAHEIKNPLSGIRGAAQLLEPELDQEGAGLTQLICAETDRIARLVSQFEGFTDAPAPMNEAVNVHSVLEHVVAVAKNGFGREVVFVQDYDPSLPSVRGDRDQLIQVFLNLVKNAVEAFGEKPAKGEVRLTSAFRPGVRMAVSGVSLPLEFCVIDGGVGIPEAIRAHIFDPFVTTKPTGTGLGLALVAKIIGDHGGIVECDASDKATIFRVLLPIAQNEERVI